MESGRSDKKSGQQADAPTSNTTTAASLSTQPKPLITFQRTVETHAKDQQFNRSTQLIANRAVGNWMPVRTESTDEKPSSTNFISLDEEKVFLKNGALNPNFVWRQSDTRMICLLQQHKKVTFVQAEIKWDQKRSGYELQQCSDVKYEDYSENLLSNSTSEIVSPNGRYMVICRSPYYLNPKIPYKFIIWDTQTGKTFDDLWCNPTLSVFTLTSHTWAFVHSSVTPLTAITNLITNQNFSDETIIVRHLKSKTQAIVELGKIEAKKTEGNIRTLARSENGKLLFFHYLNGHLSLLYFREKLKCREIYTANNITDANFIGDYLTIREEENNVTSYSVISYDAEKNELIKQKLPNDLAIAGAWMLTGNKHFFLSKKFNFSLFDFESPLQKPKYTPITGFVINHIPIQGVALIVSEYLRERFDESVSLAPRYIAGLAIFHKRKTATLTAQHRFFNRLTELDVRISAAARVKFFKDAQDETFGKGSQLPEPAQEMINVIQKACTPIQIELEEEIALEENNPALKRI